MTTDTISALRQRMIEDMSSRKLGAHTQRSQHLFDHLVGAGEPCRWDPETYALARWSPHT
jgi:hypothetical protein